MNMLFSNEVTLLWPRKGFLSRHTELDERLASSQLLVAVGREDAGNIPTACSFSLSFLSWGYRDAMIQTHLQSWSWQSQSPIYEVDFENRIPLIMSLALATASASVFFCRYSAYFYCFFGSLLSSSTQRKREDTHKKDFVSVCAILQWYFQ